MLLIMKFTAILLTIASLQVSATGFSQNITLSAKNVSLRTIFREIKKQSGYLFFFENKDLDQAKRIDIRVDNAPVEQVLKACFKDQPLTYVQVGKTIVVKLKTATTTIANQENAPPPPVEVRGKVVDEKGVPIQGVSVKIRKSPGGTTTNEAGEYSLPGIDGSAVLVFSSVGYETQEVPVKNRTTINIQLRLAIANLNETVVVAFGTQKKANLTGAVSTLSAKDLDDRPITNLMNALQGTMAGVTVVQNNGQPGRDQGSINIRGIGTLNNSNPMVVIDGLISSMSDINPNDIETISVLKDAASAAIYGSRAANGVILITSKKGKKGRLQFRYDAYVGKQKATRLPEYLPSWQQASYYNEALNNEGAPSKWSANDIQLFKDGSDATGAHPNTDWLGLFYKGNGIQQNHYLSLAGGDEKTQYLFSLGYFDQDGIVAHTNYQKYSTRFNINSALSKNFSVSANIGYLYAPFQEPASSYPGVPYFSQMIRMINRISGTVPYKYANGYYGYVADGSPMAWLESGSFNKSQGYTLTGNAGADWEFVKGLHFKPNFGYRLNINQGQLFVNDIQYYNHNTGLPSKYQGPNNLTNTYNNTTYTNLQALLEYQRSLDLHHIKILAGYSQEHTGYNDGSLYRQNFLNNAISQINAGPVANETNAGSAYEVALQSAFGRLNYDFDGKYLFEANLRYDGSSRFASSHRWGAFPSFSAGWNLSKERFFEPVQSVVSDLKLRGSWGKLGNQNVAGIYPAVSVISPGQDYSFAQAVASGVAPITGANPDITWETTTTTDVGVDASFLKNRLSLTTDYFSRNTTDILLQLPVGAPYSLSAPYQNAGAVTNKGWEFALGYRDKIRDISYGINVNTAFITNEITDLKGSGPYINGGRFQQVGYPINSLYGYIAEGIFQTQGDVNKHARQSGGVIAPGDIMYKDLNGDGRIDGNDRTYLGSYFPKMTYGLNLSLEWKGIDVVAFFQGALGVKNYVQGIMLGGVGPNVGKPTTAFLDHWTPANHTNAFPRLWYSYTNNDPGRTPSSFWVRNASYLRLKNLQIGYTIPKEIVHKIGLENIKIYYSGQNIWTATKFYKWVDPEAPVGDNGYNFPQVKVNTIGINVVF